MEKRNYKVDDVEVQDLSSDVTWADLKALADQETRTLVQTPEISLESIEVADKVFQPRLIEGNLEESLLHTKELVRVLRSQECPFDPLLVIALGGRVFVVDGHHRLQAYHTVAWAKPVPVEFFSGTLQEAMEEALKRNIKNKLPMTIRDKMESAWRLVKLGYSKAKIHELTTASTGQIGIMKKVWREQGEEVAESTWEQARTGSKPSQDYDEDWKDQKARKVADAMTKKIDLHFMREPDVLARALAMISEDLPRKLIAEWADVVEEIQRNQGNLRDTRRTKELDGLEI